MEANEEMRQWERIDSYLSGELEGEALSTFEQAILREKTLAEAVEKARISRMAIRNYGLRHSLKNIHAQALAEKKTPSRVVPIWRYAARIAASIVVVLVSVVVFRLGTVSNESLADVKDNLFSVESTRGDANSGNMIVRKMKDAYQQGDYQQCATLYENNQLSGQTGHREENLLAGNAYLALNLPERASTCFQKVLDANKNTVEKQFEDEAEYFLGLALLQENKVAAADTIFTKIYHQPNHEYHKKVSTLFYWQMKWLKFREG
jgi:tetratricopeptide (TPR) repeat protein